jgi:hypothetical protein
MGTFDLRSAAEELNRQFGVRIPAAYVPGKTSFCCALCQRFGLSQADAESACDRLERAGALLFEQCVVAGTAWVIRPGTVSDEGVGLERLP